MGVYLLPEENDGISPCTLISDFFLWKFYDVGLYVQTSNDVEVENSVLISNVMGLYPMIIGPSATQHNYQNHTFTVRDTVFVGNSVATDCSNDILDTSEDNMATSETSRAVRKDKDGKVHHTFTFYFSVPLVCLFM